MNVRIAALTLGAVAIALSAGAEETSFARVIDSSSERVPEFTVAPKYPRKARRDRVEGEVQVCFEVDRKGRPRRVAVRKSSHRAFEKPSVRAVKESSFRPLGKDEIVPSIKLCRTFVFSLEPVENTAPLDSRANLVRSQCLPRDAQIVVYSTSTS